MSVEFVTQAQLPTEYGPFDMHVFLHNDQEHVALVKGHIGPDDVVLTRVHSECLTGDGLFSLRCDCGPQLAFAMHAMSAADHALLIYLRQEGRGIGLVEKIKAYQLQDAGYDTYDANVHLGHPADNRQYDMLKAVFEHFGVHQIDIMTNNPDKVEAIEQAGVNIHRRIPIKIADNAHNKAYLKTKVDKFHHLL